MESRTTSHPPAIQLQPGLQLIHCRSGRLQVDTGHSRRVLEAPALLLAHNHQLRLDWGGDGNEPRFQLINLDPSRLLASDPELLGLLGFQHYQRLSVWTPGESCEDSAKALAALEFPPSPNHGQLAAGSREALRRLMDRDSPAPVASRDIELKLRWSGLIKQHYRRPLSLRRLADMMGVPASSASHMFARTTGSPFKRQLARQRILEAQRLLSQSEAPITEICFDCGFQSLASFYRTFQQMQACAPQGYRLKHGQGAPEWAPWLAEDQAYFTR